MPFTTVHLLSIFPTNSVPPTPKQERLPPPFVLEAGFSALFNVTIKFPNTIGKYGGEIVLHTSFNKSLHVPIYYRVTESRLKFIPDLIEFEPCFPYTVSRVPLQVKNLYHQSLSMTAVSLDLDDPRFYFDKEADGDGLIHLNPAEKAMVSFIIQPLCVNCQNMYCSV